MKIVYSAHALFQQNERKIPFSEIEDAILNPASQIESRTETIIAQKVFHNKLLRVVYKKEESEVRVITAYYTHPERYTEESHENNI